MRRPVRRRLASVVLTAVVMVAVCLGGIKPASAATGPCSHPTLHLYPGDSDLRTRYAHTVVSFDICWDTTPSGWGRSVSTEIYSGAATLGFSLENESIRMVDEETNPLTHVGYFEVQVSLRWCLPARVPPCAVGRGFAEVKAVDVGGAVAVTLGRTWGEGVMLFPDP